MATVHDRSRPQPLPTPAQRSPDDPAGVTQLSNRVAALTFLIAFLFIAGLIALGRAWETGMSGSATGFGLAPLLAAFGLAAHVRRLRTRLRHVRRGP